MKGGKLSYHNIYMPRPYGKLDEDLIVKGIMEKKSYREIAKAVGSKTSSEGTARTVISRKISTNVNIQEKLREAFLRNRELRSSVEEELTAEKVKEMNGKDTIDAICKLDNVSVNLHKALRLESGETTENFNNPQQIVMINNLYQNLQ